MSAIRAFIVDDTATVRHILTYILEEDAQIVVSGTAADGQQGLDRLERVDADVLILDVEMPGMGGLEMLKVLKRTRPTLPVIIFSSITERGAMVTIEALSLGADDYVTKPAMTGSAALAREHIRSSLIPKIKALLSKRGLRPEPSAPVRPVAPALMAPAKGWHRIDLVVVGVSTGGPQALSQLVAALPADFPVPMLIVQHMPAVFTRALAKRLDQVGPLSVEECDSPMRLQPGQILLAQGGHHLEVSLDKNQGVASTNQSEPVNFCRPSVDRLFLSAAASYGGRTLAVMMTGMGQDGLQGCEAIRRVGGQIVAQDQASSTVWGMAGSVVRAGLADLQVPLQGLAAEIACRVSAGRSRPLLQQCR